jgi:tetraacyldisaccharide 4'-kinase
MYSPKKMEALLRLYSLVSLFGSGVKNFLYQKGLLAARRAPLAVVSVGNIGLGGTGKTPLAIELLGWLAANGRRPALVSRGYRGRWEHRGGTLSDGRRLLGTWQDGGDEPYMIAKALPDVGVFVGRDRLASCRTAGELGFDAAVLDDGFQHRRLARDLDIVVYSPTWRGALRESPSGLRRADVILVERREMPSCGGIELPPGAPSPVPYDVVSRGFRDAASGQPVPADDLRGERLLAFCGIARPGRFREQLRTEGVEVVSFLTFPDHYAYPETSIGKVMGAARSAGARTAVTTAKDAVKLVDRNGPLRHLRVIVLEIGLEIDPLFFTLLEGRLGRIPGDQCLEKP